MAKTSRVNGVRNVKKNLDAFARKRIPEKVERAITEVMIIGMSKALEYTPIDKNLLMNSSFREVRLGKGKATGKAGYTQSYAAAIHDRTDWKPKRPGTPGKPTGGYNPSAKPKFLEAGFEETLPLQKAAVKRILKV